MSPPGVISYPNYRFAPDAGANVRDIEAVFEYNGLVLNDRLTPDRYRITEFDGFDEADIRDSRDVKPQQHGEFVYDSFYGGKTGLITGRIESGNYQMLHQMEQDLRSAFGALVEMPLRARYWDIFDGFDDPNALLYYGADAGTLATFSVAGGQLVVPSGSSAVMLRIAEQRLYMDSRVTAKFYQPTQMAANNGIVLKRVAANTFLVAYLRGGTAAPILAQVQGGVLTALTSTGTTSTLPANTSYWLRAYIIDNVFTAELWSQDPFLFSTPSTSLVSQQSATLSGLLADQFGAGASGQSGLYLNSTDSAFRVDDFRIESIYPGDLHLGCKKVDKLSIKHSQQSGANYYRDFQLSLRASNPRWRSNVVLTVSTPPTTNFMTGTFFPWVFPLLWHSPMDAFGHPVTVQTIFCAATNKGNFQAEPVLRIYGACVNPSVINLTNGQQVSLIGSIPVGGYVDIDLGAQTLLDNNLANQFSMLSFASDQMVLDPGPNDIVLGAASFDSNASLRVSWRHSFA